MSLEMYISCIKLPIVSALSFNVFWFFGEKSILCNIQPILTRTKYLKPTHFDPYQPLWICGLILILTVLLLGIWWNSKCYRQFVCKKYIMSIKPWWQTCSLTPKHRSQKTRCVKFSRITTHKTLYFKYQLCIEDVM